MGTGPSRTMAHRKKTSSAHPHARTSRRFRGGDLPTGPSGMTRADPRRPGDRVEHHQGGEEWPVGPSAAGSRVGRPGDRASWGNVAGRFPPKRRLAGLRGGESDVDLGPADSPPVRPRRARRRPKPWAYTRAVCRCGPVAIVRQVGRRAGSGPIQKPPQSTRGAGAAGRRVRPPEQARGSARAGVGRPGGEASRSPWQRPAGWARPSRACRRQAPPP